MVTENKVYSKIDLDQLSATLLNALEDQIAIIDNKGRIVAFNHWWKKFRDELDQKWSRPQLDDNILNSLQPLISDGVDTALRMFLGIKSVLNGEETSFQIHYSIKVQNKIKWFKAVIQSLGFNEGAVVIHEDVSIQAKNQKYLKETREKFNKHFENSLYGILVADGNQRVIQANRFACDMLETTQEAITFSDISNYINIDTYKNAEDLQKKINREGNIVGEQEITTATGKKIPIELSVTLFRNEEGSPIISWAFIDISEKKLAERALKKSEQNYSMQFNNTLEGIMIGRPNGLILKANPAACKMLGYTAEELEGQYRDIVFNMDNPINIKAVANRRENGAFSGEVEFTHKNGYTIPVEVSSVIYKAEDGTEKTTINMRDLSKRKAAQDQLIKEKEFTEKAIFSLPTAFFVFNKDGEMVRWNATLEKEFDYTTEEMADLNILDLVHPEDSSKVKDYISTEFIDRQVHLDIRCITKSGDVLHYSISGSTFKQNGESFIVGGGVNRTEVKKAENESRKNAKLFSQLFYNSPIGIALIDTDDNVKDINNSFQQIFGYNQKDLAGKNLNSIIVPDGMGEQAQKLSDQSFTGDSFQSEAIRLTKDGREVPVLIAGVPVKVDGEIIAVYGMYVDISERKALENQVLELLETEKKARLHMQDMFEESPSAIAMLEGEEHRYTFANDTYRKLVGKADLLNEKVGLALPELVEQGIVEELDACYMRGKSFCFNEKEVYINHDNKNDPSEYFLNYVIKPLYNESGNIYGIFIEAVDVTEQVEARRMIEQSLHEKNTLLGEVHHRVKNNLAIVSGLLELELMANDNKEINKLLGSTQSRITSIANIHELLYQNESLSHVNFKNYIESIVNTDSNIHQDIINTFELQDVLLNVNQAIPASMLLNEILSCLEDINTEKYEEGAGGLTFSLSETKNNVKIEFREADGALLNHFGTCGESSAQLRMELIDVLLRQLRGELNLNTEEGKVCKLVVKFEKRETKGPHNALIN